MKKIKVMHVLGSRNLWGAEKIASEICKAMSDSEFETVYASPEGPIRKVLEDKGVSYLPIGRMNPRAIARVIKLFGPDIIHAHDNKASLLSYLAVLVSRERPHIISHIHNSYPYLPRPGIRRIVDSIFRPLYSMNVFCSELTMNHYRVHAPYFNKLRGKVVLENFTDIELNKSMAGNGIRLSESSLPKVGFVGRLEYQKGLDAFFDALADFRSGKSLDADIHIVGTGSMMESLVEQSKGLGVRFEGYCENPYEWMKSFDLLILPSRYEGLPLTVLEAMSLGTPVLAMSVGAIDDVIEDGKNGWTVPKGDYSGFVEKLDYIITNKSVLAEVSEEATVRIESRFDKKGYIAGIREIYLGVYKGGFSS